MLIYFLRLRTHGYIAYLNPRLSAGQSYAGNTAWLCPVDKSMKEHLTDFKVRKGLRVRKHKVFFFQVVVILLL